MEGDDLCKRDSDAFGSGQARPRVFLASRMPRPYRRIPGTKQEEEAGSFLSVVARVLLGQPRPSLPQRSQRGSGDAGRMEGLRAAATHAAAT